MKCNLFEKNVLPSESRTFRFDRYHSVSVDDDSSLGLLRCVCLSNDRKREERGEKTNIRNSLSKDEKRRALRERQKGNRESCKRKEHGKYRMVRMVVSRGLFAKGQL